MQQPDPASVPRPDALSNPNFFCRNNKPHILLLSLLILFLAAFLIRVWGLSYFHYWDEMAYLQDAKVICCGKTNYSELPFRPPLLSLFFAAAFLIRDHIFSACIATAALNALAPVLLFLSGRRIVGPLPSALASLLLAFGQFFVGVFPPGFDSDDTGNSLLTDSPALTLILLGLWLILKALRNQRTWRFMLAGFALSLAVLMRFGSVPSVGFLCLLPLAARQRWKALAATAAGFIAGLAPYLLWSRFTYGGFFETIRDGWTHVEGPAPPFTFYLSNAPVIFSWTGIVGLLLAASAGLVALADLMLTKRNQTAPRELSASPRVLKAFLWIWLIAGFLFFSRMPHKEPRYILPLAPPLLLLSGSGLALLCCLSGKPSPQALYQVPDQEPSQETLLSTEAQRSRQTRLINVNAHRLQPIGILLVIAGMVLALLPSRSRFNGPFLLPNHPEEMDASQFLESLYPPTTPLYMNFNYPAFAYFTHFKIKELPIGGPALYRAIENIPAGSLLIAYRHNESGDPKVEVLNRDRNLEPVKEYQSFVIYRHLQNPGETSLKPASR